MNGNKSQRKSTPHAPSGWGGSNGIYYTHAL